MRAITDLNLFKQYTRASYKAEFGVDAPTYNPAFGPKSWVDKASPNGGIYKVFNQTTGGFDTLTLAKEQAGINLEGLKTYPVAVIAPSGAKGNDGNVYNAAYLSTEADATDLMNAVGGDSLVDLGVSGFGPFTVTYNPTETRRMWQFNFKGQTYNVGSLLSNKNANGVGAPGHWDTDSNLQWISEQPKVAPAATLAPVQVPVGDLLPGETVQRAGLSGWVILSTADVPATGTTSGLTDADRALLHQIFDAVTKVENWFHIQ